MVDELTLWLEMVDELALWLEMVDELTMGVAVVSFEHLILLVTKKAPQV